MILKVMEDNTPRKKIKEGDMYLMPGGTIHSPQRPPATIGLVIEIKAKNNEVDNLHRYYENCNNLIHSTTFELKNIVTELPPVMENFFSKVELRTCKNCVNVMD